MTNGKVWHDPKEYARCTAPHATDSEAEAAAAAFIAGVASLRRSLRIADVAVIAEAVKPDGTRHTMAACYGDNDRALSLVYAQLRALSVAVAPETAALFEEAEAEAREAK